MYDRTKKVSEICNQITALYQVVLSLDDIVKNYKTMDAQGTPLYEKCSDPQNITKLKNRLMFDILNLHECLIKQPEYHIDDDI